VGSGRRTASHDEQSPIPRMPGGPRGTYLAQLPQLVSGSGRILLLGGELLLLLFQLAFQDSNWVTLLHGLPAQGGTSVGTTTSRPIPSTPHTRDPALCSSGKIQLWSPRLTLRASLPENRMPSLPSTSPEARQSSRAPAAGGHDGAGSPTVCQVSWTMPAFSVRISMSCWASPSLNTMLLTVDRSVL